MPGTFEELHEHRHRVLNVIAWQLACERGYDVSAGLSASARLSLKALAEDTFEAWLTSTSLDIPPCLTPLLHELVAIDLRILGLRRETTVTVH
jgi:hypothetical protein